MYSQQELDDAVAAGRDHRAGRRRASRAMSKGNARSPFPTKNSSGSSPASTTSSSRSPRRSCCSRSAGSASRSANRSASRSSTARRARASSRRCSSRRRLGARAVLHRQAAHGAALDPAAARLRRRRAGDRRLRVALGVGPDALNDNPQLGGVLAARSRPPSPRAAAWLHWRRFRVPITVAAGAAVGRRRSPSACCSPCSARMPSKPGTSSSASCCCSASACSCSRCAGTGRIRARAHPPHGRRLLAAPAGGADDRPPGVHPARPQRRQCDDRRRPGRDRCSTSRSA